jgi:hypothetical protein
MRGMLKQSIVVGLLIPLGSWAADDAGLPAALSLSVRLYNTSSASVPELEEMKASASQIFNRAGVQVEWIPCAPGPRDSAVCPNPNSAANRIIIFVRLIDAPVQPAHRDQLHRALLGRANHNTTSAVVFYKTACAIEQNAPRIVTRGQILGHALAHEIGHLLLATDAHSLVGIMKENYDSEDLFAMGKGHLSFMAAESRVIRKKLLSVSELSDVPHGTSAPPFPRE